MDSHIVAKLSGHSDTRMLDQVYSHAAEDYAFMLQEAQKDVYAVHTTAATVDPLWEAQLSANPGVNLFEGATRPSAAASMPA